LIKTFKPEFIKVEKFNEFTYSKTSHFELFQKSGYEEDLLKSKVDPLNCDLQTYQDLLVYSFIKQNLGKGSKILKAGCGEARILKQLGKENECWNLCNPEGKPDLDTSDYRIIYDNIGSINPQLPDDYFDIIFSTSVLQLVPQDSTELYEKILIDINRVLKPGGYSLHCLDIVQAKYSVWANPILKYLYDNERILNRFIPFDKMTQDPDLFVMSEQYYSKTWQLTTGKSYEEFGRPLSYNILWKKE